MSSLSRPRLPSPRPRASGWASAPHTASQSVRLGPTKRKAVESDTERVRKRRKVDQRSSDDEESSSAEAPLVATASHKKGARTRGEEEFDRIWRRNTVMDTGSDSEISEGSGNESDSDSDDAMTVSRSNFLGPNEGESESDEIGMDKELDEDIEEDGVEEDEDEDDPIASMSFQERRQLEQRDDSNVRSPQDIAELRRREIRRMQERKKAKKRTKEMPAELSSKVPVSRKRQVVAVKPKVRRDPRFDALSGNFNADLFEKAYPFLKDLKAREMEQLKKELKTEKNIEQKHKLERALNLYEQRAAAEARQKAQQALKREWRKEQTERVRSGHKPHFMKRSELRKKEQAVKFQELKKTGKLDKYMERKSKKQASKQRKLLPNARNSDAEAKT